MTKRQTKDYEKGDNKAGGGGGRGGGGKKTRPPEGWEKGDIVRQVRELRPDADIPRKPGRAVPWSEPLSTEPEPEPELPVLSALRRTNAKLLTSLRKLDGAHDPEQRSTLTREVEEQLALKRRIESRLLPLVDDLRLAGALEHIRRLDADIDRDLGRLRSCTPDAPAYGRAVEALHGDIELQIERERQALEPAWAAELDPEQAAYLVEGLQP